MSKIKEIFTIKELQNISGINAHSIRIWERRFGLFQPIRNTNNVRKYDLNDLKKILNIALLKERGYKISKIVQLSKEEIIHILQEDTQDLLTKNEFVAQIKMAMYQFDTHLFEAVYQEALDKYSFSVIFREVYFPILQFLGLYWQTETISIAHEHFITNLIYQKIQLNIATINQQSAYVGEETFVLFLPEEEMHEIGLLYLNYELKSKGFRTVYLGRSVPLEDLKYLISVFPKMIWIANFTLSPSLEILQNYLNQITDLIKGSPHQFWGVGTGIQHRSTKKYPENIKIYTSIKQVLEILSN